MRKMLRPSAAQLALLAGMRREHLKQSEPELYRELEASGQLLAHCDQAAKDQCDEEQQVIGQGRPGAEAHFASMRHHIWTSLSAGEAD